MSNQSHDIIHGERIAENAEKIWWWDSPAGKKRAERRTSILANEGRLGPETRALEVGCGTGNYTESLWKTKSSIVAIDISPHLLKKAEERNLPDQVQFQLANAEKLPFEDQSFDAVVGSSILHHVDVAKVLSECWRVLKPKGRIVFAEPNMLNPQIFMERNFPGMRKLMNNTPDETAFVRWKLHAELEQIGLSNIKIQPYDFLHPLVPERWIPAIDSIGRFFEKVPIVKEIAGSLIIQARKD